MHTKTLGYNQTDDYPLYTVEKDQFVIGGRLRFSDSSLKNISDYFDIAFVQTKWEQSDSKEEIIIDYSNTTK